MGFWILQAIHQRHPRGFAVMHTHQAHTAAICALKDPSLMMIHQNSCRFYQASTLKPSSVCSNAMLPLILMGLFLVPRFAQFTMVLQSASSLIADSTLEIIVEAPQNCEWCDCVLHRSQKANDLDEASPQDLSLMTHLAQSIVWSRQWSIDLQAAHCTGNMTNSLSRQTLAGFIWEVSHRCSSDIWSTTEIGKPTWPYAVTFSMTGFSFHYRMSLSQNIMGLC